MSHPFTAQQLIECARREIKYRRRVYPRRVQEGRMTPNAAEQQIAMMEAIVEELQRLQPELPL